MSPDASQSKSPDRARALRDVPVLLALVWKAGKLPVSLGCLFRLLAGLMPVAMLAVSKRIVDSVVQTRHLHQSLSSQLWILVGTELALAATGAVLARAITFCEEMLADKWVRYISLRIIAHASKLDLSFYETAEFYDKLANARTQATDRILMIQSIGRLLQEIVGTMSFVVGVFMFSPYVLLLLLATLIPVFFVDSHFTLVKFALNLHQVPTRRWRDYLGHLSITKETATEIKLFDLSPYIADRYDETSDIIERQNRTFSRKRLRTGALLAIVSTAGQYGGYAYVIYLAALGKISIGTLTFLAGAIQGASLNTGAIFATFCGIADQALFLSKLLEFLNMKPYIKRPPGTLRVARPITSGIVFDNVSFVYPGSSRVVLHKLSFQIGANERIALVGENGEGKSTIVKLLTRLYDPTAGAILLDGIDLRDYDMEELRKCFSVMLQEFVQYQFNAAMNIAVSDVGASRDRGRIEKAAKNGRAYGFLRSLSNGFDQQLGTEFNNGVDLSGGEWQKLALSRAYFRNADVIILDEPTAALDPHSEHEILDGLDDLTRGKMSIIISHRFSTVRIADRIIVLKDGTISESGTHRDLIAIGGQYAQMFAVQASRYHG